jgi:NADH dehydrogenase [ubiquinone] 1 alpha subcomplex assembly factor 2
MVKEYLAEGLSPVKKLWYTWRSYRYPWRKMYFIGTPPTLSNHIPLLLSPANPLPGMDLKQNTFWEFRDRINASRPRRTVVFKDKNKDWVDYASAVSPQWHQWLRATRIPAPTIQEQIQDVVRKEVLQKNAALADARWAAKPSLLNVGPHPPPDSVLESNTKFANDSGLQRDQRVGRGEVGADLGGNNVEHETVAGEDTNHRAHGIRDHDPWAKAEEGKARGFKPGEWDPNAMVPKRRSAGRSDQ